MSQTPNETYRCANPSAFLIRHRDLCSRSFPRKSLWRYDILSQTKEGERGNDPLNNLTSADK